MQLNPARPARASAAHLHRRGFLRNTAVAAVALLLIAGLMHASPVHAAVVTEFTLTAGSAPNTITSGPDGNLWFTEPGFSEIGRITPAGVVSQFPVPSGAPPAGITAGPDGALWFTEPGPGLIGRITTAGVVTAEFALPAFPTPASPPLSPFGITAGPDGALWFTEQGCGCSGDAIGRITVSGVITQFALPPFTGPTAITTGPDGALWFTEIFTGAIGRITTTGTITQPLINVEPSSSFSAITTGPDGNLWFTECGCSDAIVRLSPAGVLLNEFQAPIGSSPSGIVSGPDGALWFSEGNGDKIGRITISGIVTNEFPLTAGAGPDGITVGLDGNIWAAEYFGDRIARVAIIAPTIATLRSLLNPSTFGQSVTFTDTLACGFGRTPTGSASFLDGAVTLGSTPLSGGVASFSTTALSVGGHAITAVYAGDGNCAAITSTVLTQVVNPAVAGTTLASSLNPSTFGQSVTIAATVACPGLTPTGTVTFKDGATTLGTPVTVGTTAGVTSATLTTSTLAVGSHSITAAYSGDTSCAPSISGALTQVVNAVAAVTSTVTLASSLSPIFVGQPVTFNATVTCSTGTLTGSSTFLDGTTSLGAGTLSTTGGVTSASLTAPALSAGSHTITATYAGAGGCPAGTSTALQQQVNAQPVSTSNGTGSGIAGQPSMVSFGFFIDTLCTPGTTYTVVINWGDGTSSLGNVSGVCGVSLGLAAQAATATGDGTALVELGAVEADQSTYAATGKFTVTGQHVYAIPDSYTAVATVSGSNGLTTSLAATVTVGRAGQLVVPGPTQLRFIGALLKITTSGCGTVSGDSGAAHRVGEFVTLTATPCAGSVFVSWTGGGPGCDGRTVSQCVVVIPADDLAITATFAPNVSAMPEEGQ